MAEEIEFSYRILEEKEQLLEKLNEEILNIYSSEKLNCLDPNGNLKFDDKNSLQFFTDITRKKRAITINIHDFNFLMI
ncbi:MAG: hypothetical protein M3R36_08990 [Bacteroidota bacterium]|nr:hypothetical protein [Bacteroidota bacterium]